MNECNNYQRLAEQILNRDLKTTANSMIPPIWDYVTDEIVVHKDNVGNLRDRDDEELAARLDISPSDWDALSLERRLARMQVFVQGDSPEEETPEIDVKQTVLDALTSQQEKLMEYLWEKRSASFDSLREVPGGWNDSPSDEGIIKKFKDMRTRLEKNELFEVELEISTAKRRVILRVSGGRI